MLGRLKAQVTEAVNKAKESELLGPRNGSPGAGIDPSTAGFVCPECMQRFADETQLWAHHTDRHGSVGLSNPIYEELQLPQQTSVDNRDRHSIGSVSVQLEELAAQLSDEKKLSAGLRDELHQLRSALALGSDVPEGEVPYLAQQIQALTAGKSLVQQQLLETEQSASKEKRRADQAQKERAVLSEKLQDALKQINSLTSDCADLSALREAEKGRVQEVEQLKTMLDQRPSEDDVLVLRKELVNAQQLMDQMVREREQQLATQTKQLSENAEERERERQLADTERKHLDDETTKLRSELESQSLDLERIRRENEELRSSIQDARDTVVRKSADLEDLDKALKEERLRNSEKLSACEQALEETRRKLDSVEKDREQLRKENEQREAQILALKSGVESERKHNEELVEKMSSGDAALSAALDHERASSEKLRAEIVRLGDEAKTRIADLEARHRQEIDAEWERNKKAKEERENEIAQEFSKRDATMEQLRSQTKDAVSKLEDAAQRAQAMADELAAKETELHEAAETERRQRTHMQLVEAECVRLQEELSQTSLQLSERDDELAAARHDLARQEEHTAARKADFERQNNQLLESHDEIQTKASELQKRFDELVAELERIKESREHEKRRADELDGQLEEERANLANIEELSARESRRADDAEKRWTETESHLASALAENDAARVAHQKLEDSIQVFEQELEKLREENVTTVAESNGRLNSISEELTLALDAREAAERAVNEWKETAAEEERSRERIEVTYKEQKTHLEETAFKLTQARSELEKSADEVKKLSEERTKLTKEKDEAAVKATRFEQLCADIRRELEKKLTEKQNDLDAAVQRETDVHVKLVESQEKWAETENQLKAELEKAKNEVSVATDRLVDLEKADRERQGKLDEFETAVAAWQQEKRALVDRCLTSESDVEFERERSTENRRRYDDALSALQELGRAHQSLQLDNAKYYEKRWLDDASAVSCHACQKQFTLLNRKHHCRLCGQIFCAQCADRTAQVASHKYPVRICHSCFDNLSHR